MHELKLQLNFTYCTYENVKKHEKIMMSFTMYHLKLILSKDLENVLQKQTENHNNFDFLCKTNTYSYKGVFKTCVGR